MALERCPFFGCAQRFGNYTAQRIIEHLASTHGTRIQRRVGHPLMTCRSHGSGRWCCDRLAVCFNKSNHWHEAASTAKAATKNRKTTKKHGEEQKHRSTALHWTHLPARSRSQSLRSDFSLLLRYSRGDDWEELKRRVEAVQHDLKNSPTGGG